MMYRQLLNPLVKTHIRPLTFQWCRETGCLAIVYQKKNLAEKNALNTVLKSSKSFRQSWPKFMGKALPNPHYTIAIRFIKLIRKFSKHCLENLSDCFHGVTTSSCSKFTMKLHAHGMSRKHCHKHGMYEHFKETFPPNIIIGSYRHKIKLLSKVKWRKTHPNFSLTN